MIEIDGITPTRDSFLQSKENMQGAYKKL